MLNNKSKIYQPAFTYDLNYYFGLKAALISENDISNVIKVSLNNIDIYIKRYFKPGKTLYRYFKPKARVEYKNLLFFAENNFNAIEIICYLEKGYRSCIVTKSLENSSDLYQYFTNNKITKKNFNILIEYINILKRLHTELKFIHKDYKLRNVLLSEDHKLYLIDCPSGYSLNYCNNKLLNIIFQPFVNKFILNRLILSNISIVYDDLRKILSVRQMLVLYKTYYNLNNKLNKSDRKNISNIIAKYS